MSRRRFTGVLSLRVWRFLCLATISWRMTLEPGPLLYLSNSSRRSSSRNSIRVASSGTAPPLPFQMRLEELETLFHQLLHGEPMRQGKQFILVVEIRCGMDGDMGPFAALRLP